MSNTDDSDERERKKGEEIVLNKTFFYRFLPTDKVHRMLLLLLL
jgi:hypothetical protein